VIDFIKRFQKKGENRLANRIIHTWLYLWEFLCLKHRLDGVFHLSFLELSSIPFRLLHLENGIVHGQSSGIDNISDGADSLFP